MWQLCPGDKLPIKYNIPSIGQFNDIIHITYIDNTYLYTCGHCFPSNAKSNYLDLCYTSGFDTPNEGEENAVLKIKQSNKFTNQFHGKPVVINNSPLKEKIYMLKENRVILGKLLSKDHHYKIQNPITKINQPFHMVFIENFTEYDNSGCPWVFKNSDSWDLLGTHVGTVEAVDPTGKCGRIAYVKELDTIKNKIR